MTNEEENKTDIEKETQKALDELTVHISHRINKFMSPVYSILDYCWQGTIVLFLFQQAYKFYTGTFPYSFYGVTILLWFPAAVTFLLLGLVISVTYLYMLYVSWVKFFLGVVSRIRTGCQNALKNQTYHN